jgi:preprotein translocase subunit SecD
MKIMWWVKTTIFIVLLALGMASLVPSFTNLKEGSSYPFHSKVSLGLDLQGGLYMILGIDFVKVYEDEAKTYARKAQFVLTDNGIKSEVGSVDRSDANDPKVSLVVDKKDHDKAKELIKNYFSGLIRLTKDTETEIQLALSSVTRVQIEEQSASKSIEVIRNRIDEFGVTEPEIMSQGRDRIIVQLPGVKDIERAKELIGKTARLEFKLVNSDVTGQQITDWLAKAKAQGIEFKKGESYNKYLRDLNEFLRTDLPVGYEISFQKIMNKVSNEVVDLIPYVVDSAPRITGDELQDARVMIDQQNNAPYVSIEFKSSGAKLFEDLTGKSIGKQLAVILDGNVYTAPNITTRIPGGRAQITLGAGDAQKKMKEATDIALILRAGALPVQLDFLEQRTIGPSLGQDSIRKASYAGIISALLVFAFLFVYYKTSGVFAALTLIANVVFVLACLVLLEATLTLPGIAGIALTIGMAVDSNIIIYERIREEFRKGANPYKSVQAGFDFSFWTILDANVTTALAGLCLLNFGTGPIRGFAVTLLIGIGVTVYCSYFMSKIMFDLYLNKTNGKKLSI